MGWHAIPDQELGDIHQNRETTGSTRGVNSLCSELPDETFYFADKTLTKIEFNSNDIAKIISKILIKLMFTKYLLFEF